MNEDELEEMMRLLEEQGWQPRECDVHVPVYGNRVPCGRPLDVADAFVERHMSLPHTIVRSIKAYVILLFCHIAFLILSQRYRKS